MKAKVKVVKVRVRDITDEVDLAYDDNVNAGHSQVFYMTIYMLALLASAYLVFLTWVYWFVGWWQIPLMLLIGSLAVVWRSFRRI